MDTLKIGHEGGVDSSEIDQESPLLLKLFVGYGSARIHQFLQLVKNSLRSVPFFLGAEHGDHIVIGMSEGACPCTSSKTGLRPLT
jgi:hypothetical protein